MGGIRLGGPAVEGAWADDPNKDWTGSSAVFAFSGLKISNSACRVVFQAFTQGLFGADWTRFQSYASRVKRISHQENPLGHLGPLDQVISQEAITAILLAIPSHWQKSLLPRVQVVQWQVSRPHSIMFLPSLVSPSTLKTLKLQLLKSEAQSVVQLLYSLAGTPMTELRTFALATECADTPVQEALSAFLCLNSGLSQVEVEGLVASEGTRLAITSMAQLRTINLPFIFNHEDELCEVLTSLVDGCPMLHALRVLLENPPMPSQTFSSQLSNPSSS